MTVLSGTAVGTQKVGVIGATGAVGAEMIKVRAVCVLADTCCDV